MKNIAKIIACLVLAVIVAGITANATSGVSASTSGPSMSGPSTSGPSTSGPSTSGPGYDECSLYPETCVNDELKSCGQTCFADLQCQPGLVCYRTSGYQGKCVVRACAAGASCTADKCRVITTPSPTPTPKHPKYKACVAKPGEPGVVAYYEDGRHEIAGRPNILHLGKDVVLKVVRGFEQCFMGTADGKPSSVYSYWRNVGKAESCPNGQILVKNAYPQWGDHMEPGANYCVRNVDL